MLISSTLVISHGKNFRSILSWIKSILLFLNIWLYGWNWCVSRKLLHSGGSSYIFLQIHDKTFSAMPLGKIQNIWLFLLATNSFHLFMLLWPNIRSGMFHNNNSNNNKHFWLSNCPLFLRNIPGFVYLKCKSLRYCGKFLLLLWILNDI